MNFSNLNSSVAKMTFSFMELCGMFEGISTGFIEKLNVLEFGKKSKALKVLEFIKKCLKDLEFVLLFPKSVSNSFRLQLEHF